jgi:hypothetical protein
MRKSGNSTGNAILFVCLIMLMWKVYQDKKTKIESSNFTKSVSANKGILTEARFHREFEWHITKDMSQQARINFLSKDRSQQESYREKYKIMYFKWGWVSEHSKKLKN